MTVRHWLGIALLLVSLLPLGSLQSQSLTSTPAPATPNLIQAIAWNPAGTIIAVGNSVGEIIFYEPTNKADINRYSTAQPDIFALDWSPDGSRLAGASSRGDGLMTIWDVNTGQVDLNIRVTGDGSPVFSVAWSPDGRRIAASTRGGASIWDSSTGEILAWLSQPKFAETVSIDWSPDGREVVTASRDGILRIWSAATGQERLAIASDDDAVVRFARWSRDGKQIVSDSLDFKLNLWDSTTGQLIKTFVGHAGGAITAQWSPDGRYLVSSALDNTIRIWNVSTGALIKTVLTDGPVYAVAWSPDGSRIAYGSAAGSLVMMDAPADTHAQQLPPLIPPQVFGVIDWTSDGRLIAVERDIGSIQIVDAESGQSIQHLYNGPYLIHNLAWQPETHQLAVISADNALHLWDAAPGRGIEVIIPLPGRWFYSMIWTPDGTRLLIGSLVDDPRLFVYNGQDGNFISSYITGNISNMVWSPDGKHLALANPGAELELRDSISFAFIQSISLLQLGGLSQDYFQLAWSLDGTRIAISSSNGIVRVLDTSTWTLIHTLNGNDINRVDYDLSYIRGLRFSPDGSRLTSISADGTIRTWDALTGQVLQTSQASAPRPIRAVSWSPDGSRIAYGSDDGSLVITDAP